MRWTNLISLGFTVIIKLAATHSPLTSPLGLVLLVSLTALNCSFMVIAMVAAHQGCILAVLLSSLFFLFIARQGKSREWGKSIRGVRMLTCTCFKSCAAPVEGLTSGSWLPPDPSPSTLSSSTPLQPHWSPRCFSTPSTLLPQSLCTCYSLC